MKSIAKIEIFEPGIVIFDPVVLNDFVLSNGVDTGNLFELFLSEETIGLSVVGKGVIFPIYQIPEMEYSIFLKGIDQTFPLLEFFPWRLLSRRGQNFGAHVLNDVRRVFELNRRRLY